MNAKHVLVFSMTKGFRHQSIPLGNEVIKALGQNSGAFTVDASEDVASFDDLGRFDAIIFNNTTGELPLTDAHKAALLKFISDGKGFVGIHAATDTLYQWPEYGQMIGAYFDGHPWRANDTVTINVEDPDHPVMRPFGDKPFELTEEIYQLKAPYDRSKLRILMSLDTGKTDMSKEKIRRTDGDFALAWVKPYGRGRVFYTALGHNESVWKDERFQAHLLAGIQWALGDLNAPAEPG